MDEAREMALMSLLSSARIAACYLEDQSERGASFVNLNFPVDIGEPDRQGVVDRLRKSITETEIAIT